MPFVVLWTGTSRSAGSEHSRSDRRETNSQATTNVSIATMARQLRRPSGWGWRPRIRNVFLTTNSRKTSFSAGPEAPARAVRRSTGSPVGVVKPSGVRVDASRSLMKLIVSFHCVPCNTRPGHGVHLSGGQNRSQGKGNQQAGKTMPVVRPAASASRPRTKSRTRLCSGCESMASTAATNSGSRNGART